MKKFLIALLGIFILTGCDTSTDLDDDKNTPPDVSNPDAEDNKYFEVLDLEYTGPYIDDSFYEITDLYVDIDGERIGTGMVFDVTLKATVDGDTAWFYVPSEYANIYTSSFRFLNMDTEETFKTPEEWGKPASVYTASLLENAHAIKLQTDPGDAIVDHYNRGLAWIWIQEDSNSEFELLNYKVLQQGLGSVAYLYGAGEIIYYDNVSYTDWMYKAQNEAKSNKRGMHSDLLDPYWDYDNATLLYVPLF